MIKTAHGLREPNTQQRIEKTIISTGMEYGKIHLEVKASVIWQTFVHLHHLYVIPIL